LADPERPRLLEVGAALFWAAFVLVWPFVEDPLVARFGVRPFAAWFLANLLLFPTASRRLPPELSLGWIDLAAFLVLIAGAIATDARVFLSLLPAWIYASLARIFAASLRTDASVVERVALRLEPNAPEFIRPYCRAITGFWAAVFLLNALGIAALALFAPPAWWRAYTGWICWLVFAALSAVEFVVRKIHFRNYDGGPIDSAFEFFFPADGNEMGRRANAYKGEMRRAQGRPERGR